MAKQKSKPTGNALNWTDADIERLATITDEDVSAAKSHADRLMPKAGKPLLKAKRKGKR